MPSWSLPSPDAAEEREAMNRRFVEASRRAEIIALVNSVKDAEELGRTVTGELCEAFEAEIAFVIVERSGGAPPEVAGAHGLSDTDAGRLLRDRRAIGALGSPVPCVLTGEDVFGIGAVRAVLAPFASDSGNRAVIGVARLYDTEWDEAELALLEAVTESTGHALDRGWLGEERDRQAAQQAAMARSAKALGLSLDLDEVLETICTESSNALGADTVIVYFERDGELEAVAAHGMPEDFVGFRRAIGEGLSGRAVRTGEPQLSNAYQEEGYAPRSTAALRGLRSGLSAPLRRRSALDGAISVGFLGSRWVTPADTQLLAAFAELAGVACRNADEHAAVQRAAMHDSLTGCLNHAAFQSRLRTEISRAERGGDPFSLVLLDLDDFKGVNERFGHLSGDTVLRTVASLLRSSLRPYDELARFGGDEFALLLPDSDEEGAMAAVERAIGSLTGARLPDGTSVMARAGVSQWRPGEQATALIERADEALRAAKRDRGGRIHRAQPGDGGELYALGALDHQRRAARRARRLARAGQLGTELSRLLDPDDIAARSIEQLRTEFGFDTVLLHRVDDAQDRGVAGRALRERKPVLVIDLQSDPAHRDEAPADVRSELAVPVYAGAELWGVLNLRSDRPGAFDEDDAQLVQALGDHVGSALRTAELYSDLERTYLGTAEALAAALEAKDSYTADHARSIADLAVSVGEQLGMGEEELRELRYGAIFHDIGKIAIPDAILNKPGTLDDAEFEVIKQHPITGDQILAPVPFLANVRRIVRHDHERWDGTGYPDGLRGSRIPMGARIVLVVDAYHAMVSDRPYRRHMAEEEARTELRDHAGTQFDPDVVEAFLGVLVRGDSARAERPAPR